MERVEQLLNLMLERKRMLEFVLFDKWSEKDGRFLKITNEITELAASMGVFVVNRVLASETTYSLQFETIDYLKGIADAIGKEIVVNEYPDCEYLYHTLDVQVADVVVELSYLEKIEGHKKTQAI